MNLGRLIAAQRAAGDDPQLFAGEVRHGGLGRLLDLWDPGARRLLRQRIDSVAPDVVHLHNVVRELSPSVLQAVRATPAVLTVHDLRALGAGEHHLPDPRAVADRLVTAPLVRGLARRHVEAVLAVSDVVAARVRAAGFPQVVSVPVPVPAPTASLEPPSRCTDVVAAAKLAPDKGIDVLIEAFARVADGHPTARLVVAGDGPDRERLQRTGRRLGSRLVFAGRLDAAEMSALMARARVVVVPSIPALRPEGSSLTAAEAARHGRPVITSDDPAAAEVGRSIGAVVTPAGDAAALAEALEEFLRDGALADRAGGVALQRADRYDVTRVAEQVRSAYVAAIEAAGRDAS